MRQLLHNLPKLTQQAKYKRGRVFYRLKLLDDSYPEFRWTVQLFVRLKHHLLVKINSSMAGPAAEIPD
jgi:hypothetical protein